MPINRETLRGIKNLSNDKLVVWLASYAKENYDDGFGDGVESNTMAIMRYLHDEFGWGNTRFQRLIDLAKEDVKAIQEKRVTVQEFRDGLAAEGCKCLKELQLKSDPPVDRWRPVTEDLPENEDKVLCCTVTKKGLKNLVIGYYSNGRWCCGMNSNVVAWRILPPVYEERKEETHHDTTGKLK